MLIAIEGCLGVGKSTVAEGLAAFRRASVLLEKFEDHPFLRAFYEDPKKTATETEFAFLMLHYHQLKSHSVEIADREAISDFHLGKDLIYADLNLPDPRMRKVFRDLYELCAEEIAPPSLFVFLSATDELLVDRIRSRNRDFEQDVDVSYYSSINAAYQEFFSNYKGNKIEIPMASWDFVKFPKLFERLSLLVDEELGTGA
jgi:deoxyguanosine kinase